MKRSSDNSRVKITQLGEIACSCLTPGQRGKVLAAFSKAIYLLTDDSELIWISNTEVPMHQRCVQVSSHLPGLSAGVPFHVQDHCLMIDSAFAFNIQDALVWRAPHMESRHVLGIPNHSERVQTFFSNLDISQAKGFGNFIPHILFLSQESSTDIPPELSDSILLFAHPLVMGIARACAEDQPSQISQNADALVGLGAGLTPSGDDFLGGFLFAVKNIQTMNADMNLIDYEIPVDPYSSQTNLISFTLLKDLANGQAIAPLHHILNILLSGESLESIYPFVSKLTRVGHSTGWDLLTGLLTGLLVTYRESCFTPHK